MQYFEKSKTLKKEKSRFINNSQTEELQKFIAIQLDFIKLNCYNAKEMS